MEYLINTFRAFLLFYSARFLCSVLYVCKSSGPTIFVTGKMTNTPYSRILPASFVLAHDRIFKYRYKRRIIHVRLSHRINSKANFISDTMNNHIVINDGDTFANTAVPGNSETKSVKLSYCRFSF